jgi:hypothetical protein
MARGLVLGIVVMVSMVIAYVFKGVVSDLLTAIKSVVTVTTFEAALIVLMPYIALVYLAIVRPIVDFWSSRRD